MRGGPALKEAFTLGRLLSQLGLLFRFPCPFRDLDPGACPAGISVSLQPHHRPTGPDGHAAVLQGRVNTLIPKLAPSPPGPARSPGMSFSPGQADPGRGVAGPVGDLPVPRLDPDRRVRPRCR